MKTYLYSVAALAAIMTVTTAEADYPGAVLSRNPSAYWRLNETTPVPLSVATNRGTLGQSANGQYLLGATHPVTGIPGGGTDTAATIPNPNNASVMRIRVPFQPGLNPAQPFTAEFWAKPSQQGTGTCPYSSIDFASAKGWLFYQEAIAVGQWSFRVYHNAGTTISGGTVTAGAWHHVVGAYDGANMSLYVNGQLVAGPTPVGGAYTPVANPNVPLTIGCRASDTLWTYMGDLDEVVLYTNVLSSADIEAHYEAGTNALTGDYTALIVTNNPPGYWRLGEPALTLPVAVDSGYLGTSAQGTYLPNMTNGVAGPAYSGLGAATTVAAFNGLDGYVNFGASVPDLSAPLSSLTIMTWAKFSTNRAMDWESIITCGDTAWELQRPNNDYGVNFRFAGTDVNTPSTRPINDGAWHHIAATYDGAQQKIYIDGALAASGAKTGSNLGETTYPILIGENGRYPGRIFKGNLAEVAVFTNALSASDIATIYNTSWTKPAILIPAYASPSNYVYEGTAVTLNVKAGGVLPLHYQWYNIGGPLSGATASSYALTASAVVADSGTYSVVVTNSSGSITSSVVLTVAVSPPVIITQPASTTAFVGAPASFTVVDAGSLPRYYQWKHGSTAVSGGTAATLTLPNVQWADAGTYTCTITNVYGATNTAPATLTIAGEFVGLTLPTLAARDRHTALGSDGSYLYYTPGNKTSAEFYRLPQMSLSGWATRASLPTPATIDQDSGVGDLCYFGGALWCWGRDPANSINRVVYHYDIASDTWTSGATSPTTGGPNSSCAVIGTTNILGGWMGANPVYQATDWANGVMAQLAVLPGGAVHPWDSCVGPNAVYFIKHWNVASSNAVLASFTKTGTPTVSYINGVPFNIGMGCAIEYMPATLFGDGHDRLYILRGMTGTTDDDASDTYGHWVTPTTTDQLASYDLVSHTWAVQTLPFVIDVGSEMCLLNQTLYILAANSDQAPLKMLYLGPPVKPLIANQPVSQTIYAGQSATFSVGAFGGGPFTYSWRRDGVAIPGATQNMLVISGAGFGDTAGYDVLVTNPAGSTNSAPATLTVLPLPTFAFLTNDLVLHLAFNGDLNDSSGNGNNGLGFGTLPFVPGKLGQAIELSTVANALYNFVQVSDNNGQLLFDATNSFSIALWLKYTNDFSDLPILGNALNSTYNKGYVLTEDHNQFEWTIVDVSGTQVIADPVGGPLLNDGNWHQLTLVVDRSSQLAQSYVDGVLIDTRSVAGVGSLITFNNLTIGQDPGGQYKTTGTFDLDDVGIWARALSPTDAEAIYLVGQNYGRSFDLTAPINLTIRLKGSDVQVIWQAGTLWSSTNGVSGTYYPVSGASAPYYEVRPGTTPTFYKVK